MTVKSSTDHYGSVAATLHWLTALLIIALLISGIVAEDMQNSADKAQILSIHAPMAILVLILTLLRIFWWWLADNKPAPVKGQSKRQEKAARYVHILFYILIIGMCASGIGMMVLSGAGDIIYNNAPRDLPDFNDFTPRLPHGIGAKLMILLLIGHAGAALYHQFIKKDGVLSRMSFKR